MAQGSYWHEPADPESWRIGLTLFIGIGIGAAAMHGLHAQAKPPAYLISDVTVTDENGYKEYIEKFPPTLVPFGGKFLVRAGQTVAAQSAFLPRFSVRMALSRDVAVPISQRVPQTVDVQTLVPTASPEATRKSRCTLVDPTFTANEGSKRFIMRFVLGTVTEHSRPF